MASPSVPHTPVVSFSSDVLTSVLVKPAIILLASAIGMAVVGYGVAVL